MPDHRTRVIVSQAGCTWDEAEAALSASDYDTSAALSLLHRRGYPSAGLQGSSPDREAATERARERERIAERGGNTATGDIEISRLRQLVNTLKSEGDVVARRMTSASQTSASVRLRNSASGLSGGDGSRDSTPPRSVHISRRVARAWDSPNNDDDSSSESSRVELDTLRRIEATMRERQQERSQLDVGVAQEWVRATVGELQRQLVMKNLEIETLQRKLAKVPKQPVKGAKVSPRRVGPISTDEFQELKLELQTLSEDHASLEHSYETIARERNDVRHELENLQQQHSRALQELAGSRAELAAKSQPQSISVNVARQSRASPPAKVRSIPVNIPTSSELERPTEALADALTDAMEAVKAQQRARAAAEAETRSVRRELAYSKRAIQQLQRELDQRVAIMALRAGARLGKYNMRNGNLVDRWVSVSEDGRRLLYGPPESKKDRSAFSFVKFVDFVSITLGPGNRRLKPMPPSDGCVFTLRTAERDLTFVCGSERDAATWVALLSHYVGSRVSGPARNMVRATKIELTGIAKDALNESCHGGAAAGVGRPKSPRSPGAGIGINADSADDEQETHAFCPILMAAAPLLPLSDALASHSASTAATLAAAREASLQTASATEAKIEVTNAAEELGSETLAIGHSAIGEAKTALKSRGSAVIAAAVADARVGDDIVSDGDDIDDSGDEFGAPFGTTMTTTTSLCGEDATIVVGGRNLTTKSTGSASASALAPASALANATAVNAPTLSQSLAGSRGSLEPSPGASRMYTNDADLGQSNAVAVPSVDGREELRADELVSRRIPDISKQTGAVKPVTAATGAAGAAMAGGDGKADNKQSSSDDTAQRARVIQPVTEPISASKPPIAAAAIAQPSVAHAVATTAAPLDTTTAVATKPLTAPSAAAVATTTPQGPPTSTVTGTAAAVPSPRSPPTEPKEKTMTDLRKIELSTIQAALPNDWRAARDKSDFKIYYWNKSTKQTVWDAPTVSSADAVRKAGKAFKIAVDALEKQWVPFGVDGGGSENAAEAVPSATTVPDGYSRVVEWPPKDDGSAASGLVASKMDTSAPNPNATKTASAAPGGVRSGRRGSAVAIPEVFKKMERRASRSETPSIAENDKQPALSTTATATPVSAAHAIAAVVGPSQPLPAMPPEAFKSKAPTSSASTAKPAKAAATPKGASQTATSAVSHPALDAVSPGTPSKYTTPTSNKDGGAVPPHQNPKFWRSTKDAEGATYYWNTKTKETTWTKPSCLP